jgi:transcriptional regulator with XRE-family HTH domain
MDPREVADRFGDRLRELRTAKGWTQGELADRAGMAKAGIANLEQGRTGPSWETVVRLCAALGVPCDAFQEPPSKTEARSPGRPAKVNPSAAVRKSRRGRNGKK